MASKSFQVSIDFIGNVNDLQSKIRQVTGEINKIGSTSGGAAVQKQFDQLTKSVTDLQTRINQPIKTQGDFNKIAGEVQKIELSYNNLIQTIQRLQSASDGKKLELLPANQQNKIKQAEQAIENYEKTINRAGGSLKRFQELQDKKVDRQGALSAAKKDIKDYEAALDSVRKKLEELNAEEAKLTGDKTKADKRVKSLQGQISNQRTSQEAKEAASSALPEAKAQAQELEASLARVNQQKKQLNEKQTGLTESLTTARKEAGTAEAAIKSINDQIKQLGGDNTQALQTAFDNLKQKAAELKVNLDGIGKDATAANVEMLTSRLRALKGEGLEQADAAIIKMANDLEAQLGGALQKNRSHIEQTTQAWSQFVAAQEDVSMLQNRLKYFFSLTNSIQLLKRTVQSAVNTVKELDKVMTETAVVTDFSIGDMWDKLPEYATQASALGSSIKELYSATTLYYQQGLNSEQAMGLGVETMKMARIAGLDAADATQHMTAALRGFNMEINEVSAQRVNDVYSELAAITAADTGQIATAMSKTASIADSANMEFETTAALLAQIIETTQEAPETAGTAMKTIIARFTEVKELFSEGMLTGEDEEGEEININKIDAALRTVGISLKDFLNGSKGIDDIFLELASKWDTLDLATQRYIATTAAGSRQQSRFIAMMSNYDRTMELVTAANNSAGASQEQFDKTMESLEAKLQQLQNAWNQFTMGIANSDVIKGGIDMLTKLLETVNKLMDALSGGSGAGKGLLSLMSVIGALKGGKALLTGGLGFIGKSMGIPQPLESSEKEVGAFQRAAQYSKQGDTFKQKAGYYTEGLFSKKEDAAFNQKIKELQEAREELDAYSNLNYRAAKSEGIVTQLKGTDKAISELKGIQAEFEETGKISDASAKTLEHYGLTAQDVAKSVYPLRMDLQAVGAAATLAGGAFGLLANVLEKNGMDKGAEACRTLSTAMMGLGSVLMLLPTVLGGASISLKGFKVTVLDAAGAGIVFQAAFWQIALVAAIVVGIIWGLVAAFKAIHAASPEGKLEAATEAANDAAEAAENAAQAYEHLASALDSVAQKSGAIKGLAAGTSEFKKAASELNGEVSSLVEQYPELADYIDSSRGYLTFKEDTTSQQAIEKILNEKQDASIKAESASIAANMKKQQAQQDYDYSQIEDRYKVFSELEGQEKKEQYEAQVEQIAKAKANQLKAGNPFSYSGDVVTPNIESVEETIPEHVYRLSQEKTEELARAIATGEYAAPDWTDDVDLINALDKIKGNNSNYADSEIFKEFKKYGEGLLQSDAIIETQAKSLLSNASMISNVPEEQKADMMNFFNAKQVSSKLDIERANLEDIATKAKLPGATQEEKDAWEEQKKAYATAMGYNYSNGNLYKGEAIAANKLDLKEEDLIEQIAGMNVTDQTSEAMSKLAPKLSQMDASEAKLLSAFSSQNLDNLTIGEISSLEDKTIENVATDLEYDTAQQYAEDLGYQDLGAFQDDIDKFKAEADKQKTKVTNWFDSIMLTDDQLIENNKRKARGSQPIDWISENLADASYSTLNGLKEQASQMAPDAAKEYLNSFAETVKNKDLSEQEQKALQSYLSNVDWSDMIQAVNAMEYMQDMNLDPSSIESFWNTATGAANTYISTLQQAATLSDKFQGNVKKANEIEDALKGGTATSQQVQELIESGAIDVNDLELTAEGWKAKNDEVAEKAMQKMRENNAASARAAVETQRKQYTQAVEDMAKFGIIGEEGAYENVENFAGELAGAIIAQDGKLAMGDASNFTKETYDELASMFDMAQGDQTAEQFQQAIQDRLMSFINLLNNYSPTLAMLEQTAQFAENTAYGTVDMAVANGVTGDAATAVMQQEATALSLDPQEVTQYAESLQRTKQLEQEVAAQVAIDYAKMKQGMEEVVSKWDEWQDRMKKPNDMEKAVAFKEMADAANKMLGVTDVLDGEFIELEGLMDDIKKAAEGDADAFDKLQKAAGKKLAKELRGTAKEGSKLDKIVDGLEETIENFNDEGIDVGEVLQLDDTNIDQAALANELTNMYNLAYNAAIAGGASVQQAVAAGNAAIEAAGYEAPEMEEKTETVTTEMPPDIIATAGASVSGGLNNSMVGTGIDFESQPNSPVTYTYTRMVPKEGSGYTKKAETPHASGGGGGGGGGGGKKEPWKNPFDKLHNIQENIDRTVREREKIEKRYQRLIDRRIASAQELQRLSHEEVESLKEQAKYQQKMLSGREEQLREYLDKHQDMQKYATYDFENQMVLIDWDRINQVTDEEEGQDIEDYVDQLEEWRDSIVEVQEALEDIDDAVWEIEQRGREEYMEFEDRVKEALVEIRQKEIDALEEINDSINDTNDKLLDSIQQSIDKMRQDRENEKTEEDLQEKQRRLAYLEQDTSNANAMEILELRKEIEEGQEDYTDTLIDQKISELQEQNDKAAEQREKQITLLQNQLDWEVETGRIWQTVEALMQDGLDPQGGLIRGSMLEQTLQKGENWKGLSDIGQMNWLLDLETMIAQSMNWKMTNGQLENLENKLTGQEITFKDANGNVLTGKVDEKGQVWTDEETYYKNVYQWIDGTYHTTEESATKYVQPKPVTNTGGSGGSSGGSGSGKKGGGAYVDPTVLAAQQLLNRAGYSVVEDGIMGPETQAAINKYQEEKKKKQQQSNSSNFTGKTGKFATGGLADFTGPAWLDGTKSRPELVLNQRDTQNFIQLKDILSSIMTRNFSNTQTSTENNGDITYDIDINVETMGSDYDVEQVANKVKSMINEDARYRNNNVISLKR